MSERLPTYDEACGGGGPAPSPDADRPPPRRRWLSCLPRIIPNGDGVAAVEEKRIATCVFCKDRILRRKDQADLACGCTIHMTCLFLPTGQLIHEYCPKCRTRMQISDTCYGCQTLTSGHICLCDTHCRDVCPLFVPQGVFRHTHYTRNLEKSFGLRTSLGRIHLQDRLKGLEENSAAWIDELTMGGTCW